MEALFESSTLQLKEDPSGLNAVTNTLLKEAAKEHHPHNRLLPASFIQSLLSHIAPDVILGCNQEGQEYLLAANCLRGILITNFPQLQENKIFRAIVMNYAQTLNAIVRKQRQETENGEGMTLKYAARGYILNEIMLKLVQISHVFIPEVLRFAKVIIQLALSHLQLCEAQGETTEKQLRIASKLAENSKIPTSLYKLSSRKVWKKSSFIIFIKFLFEQTKTFLTTCGYSKHALGLQIYKQILSHFEHFKALLSPSELAFLSIEETTAQSKQPQNQEVYLQQPLKVRELTPRFYDEEQTVILSKLRKKKQKLTKKIQTELRKGVIVKQQEAHVREEVRREKGQRQQKKEQLIIERQTVQVKKYNKQIKKVKQARKGPKNPKNTGKPSPLNKKGRK